MLEDNDYCNQVAALLNLWSKRKQWYENLHFWWEALKKEIRKLTSYYVRNKRLLQTRDKRKLLKEFLKLKRKASLGFVWAQKHAQKLFLKLREIETKNANEALYKSRIQWLEEGEKPTRYFLKLEIKRLKVNSFSSLLNENGKEITDHEGMKNILISFYSNLFGKEELDLQIQDDLLKNVTKALNSQSSTMCNGYLTLEELTNALNSLPSRKSPGSDGLTLEFYRKFWQILGNELVSVLNLSYDIGELPSSQRECIIRLFYKKDDKRNLKNWRPISLLNVDYKLCAKALSVRLKKVLPEIIHENQSCSVPNRKISSNLILLQDLLDYICYKNVKAIMINLDQEKAFDRVDWDFLYKLLELLRFGSSFIRWIKLLYNKISCRIICNNDVTDYFFPSRGVRQGCFLSPLLYIIIAEVLCCNIRASQFIDGFKLPGGPIFKLSQYADDTTCIVPNLFSLEKLLQLMDFYGKGTGAKLNLHKTEAMWLGAWSLNSYQPFGIKWVTKIKILGVFLVLIPIRIIGIPELMLIKR